MFESAVTHLPMYHTNLIGRVHECAAIVGVLSTPTVRLLTLIGESGAGKTRLALESAAIVADRFPDGIVFVSLAPVQDAAFVIPTIAATLQIEENPGQSLISTLKNQLYGKAMLLILDNMEQVRAASNELAALLQETERLTLLVTSQIALNIPAETTYEVPPLATPPLETNLHPLALLEYPAIALFVSRLQEVQPRFKLSVGNAVSVIRICQLLDGFPLAIELVAAHSVALSPNDLLLLLRNHLGMYPHQRGIVASSRADILDPVLTWCLRRLPEGARQLMNGIGVFLGGWTVESAQAILAPARTVAEVAQDLELLVQKHLILKQTLPGQPLRFTALDAIRLHSEQLLIHLNQWQAIHHSYATYYSNITREALPAKQGEQQSFWLERLETEYHNIRSALHWSRGNDHTLFIQLTSTLGWFWRTRCHLSEASLWIEQALKHVNVSSKLHSGLLYEAGMLALLQNVTHQARNYLEHSLSIYQDEADLVGIAETLNELGNLYCNMDDLAESRHAFEQAIAIWKGLGRPWEHAVATANLGYIHLMDGRHDQAMEAFDAAQSLLPPDSDKILEGNILTNIGWTAYVQGQAGEAYAYFKQALDIHQRIKSPLFLPEQLEGLAGCACRLGLPERAARLLGAAVRIRETISAPVPRIDQPRYDQIVHAINQRLDTTTFMRFLNQGQQCSVEEIVSLVLEDDGPMYQHSGS
ncbi:MAG TPA: tetratricopeptide repeat protein [Herpetosiphonaceae bacterium]|nr:tetratricopeptide repeat protein [Herpetosiphonaceae bacterium]